MIEFIAEEWPVEYVLIARMMGNEHLRYVRADDWSLVFTDPEGIEWSTHSYYAPILGETTIECSPEWFAIMGIDEDDWESEVTPETNEDMDKFANEFCIPHITQFIFEHHSYISKDDPSLPAKLAGKTIVRAPEWAWQKGNE